MVPLAKLTPPAQDKIYPRTRLHRELDALAGYPVLWISAPGGAGKTTLVANYLATQDVVPLWFQVDPSDGDIASFFYYLGEGLKRLTGARKRVLPLLTPEYQLGVPAFTRLFFRKLFATMKAPAVLVLDNIEVLHDAQAFNEVLRHGLEEIPPGARVIITGRCLPPLQFSRLTANGRLAQLGWDKLQVTREESRGIIELLSGEHALPEAAIPRLQEAAQGWMAGLVLLLNLCRQPGPTGTEFPLPSGLAEGFSRQRFDAYFANEIFNQLPPDTQALLLKTAWLTPVRAETAQSLSGNERAGAILRHLEENQMFVISGGGTEPEYTYHPLLRAFLQAEAERTLKPQALNRLRRETAAILAREGNPAVAARLYTETRHWSALAQLILENAQALWEQGRIRQLRQWLDGLPPGQVEHDPWLAYWYGNTLLLSEPQEAGRFFETALRLFGKSGDATGVCLSLTGILDSIMYRNDSLEEVPRWLDVLKKIQRQSGPCPVPAIAVRLEFAAFNMQFLACPERASATEWRILAQRLEQRVPGIPDDTLRCMSASHLAMYYTWCPQPARLRLLADTLYKYAISEEVPPLARLIAYLVEITRRWVTARTDGTDAVIEEALRVMETHGVYVSRLWLLSAAIFYYLTRGELSSAARLLNQFHAHMRPPIRNEQAHYHFLAAWLASLREDPELAHEHAETACTQIKALHTPHFELLSRVMRCLTLIKLGRYDEALCRIGEAKDLAEAIHARHIAMFHLGLLDTWIAWRRERAEAALRHLRPALACGRELSLRVSPGMDPSILTQLCALALEHDIETAYVRRLIQWNALSMPAGVHLWSAWPIPVRIHTLGRFDLCVHGRCLSPQPAHNKPLKLLRVLIALGGREVADSRIEDILWPDAEGNAAHRALITNLQRLRRLLGGNHLVQHQNGYLSLGARYCWVDVWALEWNSDGDEPEALIRLLKLYRGDFLHDEEEAWWLLGPRERLRAKILHCHERLQKQLAAACRWQDLIEWCQRGLEIDALHEPFHRRLIHAYQNLGQYGEAVRAYHRCRRELHDKLGTAPSPETRALFESLPTDSG